MKGNIISEGFASVSPLIFSYPGMHGPQQELEVQFYTLLIILFQNLIFITVPLKNNNNK